MYGGSSTPSRSTSRSATRRSCPPTPATSTPPRTRRSPATRSPARSTRSSKPRATLVRQKGQAVFVFPSGRVVDLIATLREKKLEPRRIQFVHSNEHSAAKLVLVEALKGAAPGLKVMRPLVLFNLEGRYTDEVSGILHNPQTRH